jgi:hypothetical protein
MRKSSPVNWDCDPLKLDRRVDDSDSTCQITRCRDVRHDDWPVCFMHAILISRAYDHLIEAEIAKDTPQPPTADPVVYYLMVGPNTVKIGTTKNLPQRLTQMRTEMQYVVAHRTRIVRRRTPAASTVQR